MSDISPVYPVTDWGSVLSSMPTAQSNIRSQTVQQGATEASIPVEQAQAGYLQSQTQLSQQDVQAKNLANQFAQFRLKMLQTPMPPLPDPVTGAAPAANSPSPQGGAAASGATAAANAGGAGSPVAGGSALPPDPKTVSAADGGQAMGPDTASGADNPFDPAAEGAKMDAKFAGLRVNKDMTPYEAAYYNFAQNKDREYALAGFPSMNLTAQAQAAFEKRVGNETALKQRTAQAMSDSAYDIADPNNPAPFALLRQKDPANAAKLQKIADANGWSQQDLDDHARQYATMAHDRLFQYTGDTTKDLNGANVNSRTGLKSIGEQTQTLTPAQVADVNEKGLTPTKVPYGTGEATETTAAASGTGNLAGYRAAVTGAGSGVAQPGGAAAPKPTAAAPAAGAKPAGNAPAAAPKAGSSSAPTLPGIDINSLPDLDQSPAPKMGVGAQAGVKSTQEANAAQINKARLEYQAQSQQAQKNDAVYTQLQSKLQNADPRYYGPSSSTATALANFRTYLTGKAPDSLITQTEIDKYLTQQGVLGAKNLLGAGQQLRQQELLLLIGQANPNINQTLPAIKNLVNFGKINNDYDLRMSNTGLAAIRANKDPGAVAAAFSAPGNSRNDYVQSQLKATTGVDLSGAAAVKPPPQPGQTAGAPQEGATNTSKSGRPMIYVNGHWQYSG